jgi:hypothetical protein
MRVALPGFSSANANRAPFVVKEAGNCRFFECVAWLQVAVDDSFLVSSLERIADLPGNS